MHSPEASIHCPNPSCQAYNPESHRFCQQCRTPVPHVYLWGVGADMADIRPGNLLVGRYFCKHSQVYLDTQPNLLPETPNDLTPTLDPYLRLVSLQPRVPQVYAVLPSVKQPKSELLLLEQAPIYDIEVATLGNGSLPEGTVMPAIDTLWPTAIALRQLNWLWQLAQLWEPLNKQRVAQTLLTPEALRADGGIVRLLELVPNPVTELTLADLGRSWQRWLATAQPAIADFLTTLCHQLEHGQIRSAEHLEYVLDGAMSLCGATQPRQLRVVTLTDQGPNRERNEDACFPPSGSVTVFPLGDGVAASAPPAPVVVCDGIGGHEGGNIASQLAIATIQQHLQAETSGASAFDSAQLTHSLETAALAANETIFQRNDAEQRHDRQRMGTTLVMALGHRHQLYITHVGDSRAYRVSSRGCDQVTVDDDLATREVRLGYALYRQALRQPSSGSLVQALGMSASSMLHPTVQRFVLDEDCLFLLCSDGLSDRNRVEQHWQSVLLPVLTGQVDLQTAAQQLVAIANEQNGHDNVTVGLVHCVVAPAEAAKLSPIPVEIALQPPPESLESTTLLADAAKDTAPNPAASTLKTKNLKPLPLGRRNPWLMVVGLLFIAALGSGLTYLLITGFEQLAKAPSAVPPSPSVTGTTPSPDPSGEEKALSVGSRFVVNRANPNGAANAPIVLLPQAPGTQPAPGLPLKGVPLGGVLEVVAQQRDRTSQPWLQIKVCSLAQSRTVTAPGLRDGATQTAQPGDVGWVQAEAIAPFITSNVNLTSAQLGQCLSADANFPVASPTPVR